MESGVIKYDELDGLPVIAELVKLWGEGWKVGKAFTRNGRNWIKVKGPRSGHTHPRIAHMWRESAGLYLVFCDAGNWKILDPLNVRGVLTDYVGSNTDWRTYRVDGTVPDPSPEALPNARVVVVDQLIKFDHHPTEIVDEQNPKIVGDLHIHKYWPTVGSTIGQGNRIDEASTKPTMELIR